MKTLLLAVILFAMFSVPVFGQFSDKTGLNSRLYVDAGGHKFEVLTTANFDVPDAKFNLDEKTLTLNIISSLENNFGEILIPKKLLGGNLTFLLDGDEFFPKINSNEKIWFITTTFNGTRMHTLQVIGTESVNTNSVLSGPDTNPDDNGCLIATAAFGSEMSPQVQLLRELRDDTVLQTQTGAAFMTGFNQFYYSFSPTIADWERQNPVFREAVKVAITPLLSSLLILNYVDIDSESEMLGYGIGIIMANVGMYFAPLVGFVVIRKYRLFNQQ